MITELTAEQEARIPSYIEKWRNIGLSTELANRPEAEYGIQCIYQRLYLEPPSEIIWCDSPEYMYMLANENLKWVPIGRAIYYDNPYRLVDYQFVPIVYKVRNEFRTNLGHLMWRAFVVLIRQTMNVTLRAIIDAFYNHQMIEKRAIYDYLNNEFNYERLMVEYIGDEIVARNAGWWIPFKNVCLISERHTTLHSDNENRPHCEDGLAISYPDGWGVYAWHGVKVPEYVIMRPHEITPDKIVSEENTEISRVMIERYGQDNFIRNGGFSKTQSDDYGDLYRVEFNNGDEPIVAVHVQDASTDRDYFLYVPPHIRSAHEGIAWTFGYDNVSDYNPDQET